MFEDAREYSMMGFVPIKCHCLNTYHPVFMWLPKKSLMRKQYRRTLGSGPEVLAGLRESWGPLEHSMHHPEIVFSNDGTRMVSGSRHNTVRTWNSTTREMERILEGHSGRVRSVAFSSDGTHVVSCSLDKLVLIWNGNTGEIEHVLEGHSDYVMSVAISDDGTRVVSGSKDTTIRIWNAMTKAIEHVLKGHSDRVMSVAISDDGTRVVSGSLDRTVRIWNANTGEMERVLYGHSGYVMSVAFSRDGTRIVSGSWDGTVRIWNAVMGEIERVLKGRSDLVLSVAFSPDGTHVVSGSWNQLVLVWDTITEVATLLPHTESFQFPDESNVTHTLLGMFQLFAPGQKVMTMTESRNEKWILTDRSSEGCWIPSEFRDIAVHAISGSKLCLGCRSGRVAIVDLMPPH